MNQIKLFSSKQHSELFNKKSFTTVDDLNKYIFSIIWRKGAGLVLFQLEGSIGDLDMSPKYKIITETRTDNDGEISISVGDFVIGTSINLWWGIRAIDPIQKCSVWITNVNTKQAKKIKPASPNQYQDIAVNGNWIDSQNKIILF